MIGPVCYSCHLDSYIPDGYERHERYRRDGPWPHANATCRPPLGVPFLDEGGDRVHQMALLAPRLRAVRWWCRAWGPRSRR